MVRKVKLKVDSKKEKTGHFKELASLKILLSDYKVERKADWKSFKNTLKDRIDKIEKSMNKPVVPGNK